MTNQPPSASGSAPTVTAPMTMSLWRWYFTYEGPPFTIAHQRIAMDVSNFGPSQSTALLVATCVILYDS